KIRTIESTRRDLTADQPTFLVLEVDDLQRMRERHLGIGERSRDLERGKNTQRSVESAAVRDAVGVRSDNDGSRIDSGAGASPEGVPAGVDADVESRVVHQLADVLARGEIRVAVGGAIHAAVAGAANCRE